MPRTRMGIAMEPDTEAGAGAQHDRKTRWSWPAVVALVFGVLLLTPLGVVAIPFGCVGLRQTNGGEKRGRKAAKWGALLGCLSLVLILRPTCLTVLQPPVLPHDRSLQRMFDAISEGKFDDARRSGLYFDNIREEEFVGWADGIRKDLGRGRVVLVEHRLYFPDLGGR